MRCTSSSVWALLWLLNGRNSPRYELGSLVGVDDGWGQITFLQATPAKWCVVTTHPFIFFSYDSLIKFQTVLCYLRNGKLVINHSKLAISNRTSTGSPALKIPTVLVCPF